VLSLNRVGDKLPGRGDSGNSAGAVFKCRGHTTDFGKRAARPLLHHPKIRAYMLHQQSRFTNQAAVNAAHAHHDHEQEPDAHGGEREPPEVVADIFSGQVHRRDTRCPSLMLCRLRSATITTRSPAETPLATSTRLGAERPSTTVRQAAFPSCSTNTPGLPLRQFQ